MAVAEREEHPPLTRFGKWTVGIGVVLIAVAAGILFLGGTSALDSCTSVTTSELPEGAPSSTASGGPTGQGSQGTDEGSGATETPSVDVSPSPVLVDTKRVVTCSPSGLASGAPLVLAVLGGVLLAPGVLRLLPPGKYAVGGVAADTTSPGQEANDQAAQASALLAALNAQTVNSPGGVVPEPPPAQPEG